MDRKPRIDGTEPSPLQRLKNLSEDEHEFLMQQRKKVRGLKLIAQIETRHGIYGLTQSRLSEFWRWLAERAEVRAANESVQNIRAIFAQCMPNASAEETHKFLVQFLAAQGFANKSEKTLRFVTIETRKSIETAQKDRRLQLLERQAAAATKTLQDKKLTPQEREQKMREVFGLA